MAVFRAVILLNLVVTFVSLWLTFDGFNRLAWNSVWVWHDFARQLRPVMTLSSVVMVVQLLLQTPAIALCVVLVAGLNFSNSSRWQMIALTPLVACMEFMLLARGMNYLQVVFAPVPLLVTALLLLLLFNPALKTRFSSRQEAE